MIVEYMVIIWNICAVYYHMQPIGPCLHGTFIPMILDYKIQILNCWFKMETLDT